MIADVTYSLHSTYKGYDMHITILKWTGVVVLAALVITSVAVTSASMAASNESRGSDCIRIVNKPPIDLNVSLCTYMKQFDLPDGYVVSVCRYQDSVRIDLRQFINGRATIRGIALNVRQWEYLQRITSHIWNSVRNATSIN